MFNSKQQNFHIAAIDLGSNSFRLLVARNNYPLPEVLQKELRTVRLAHHLADNALFSETALQRAFDALEFFAESVRAYPDVRVRICGTEALRKGVNRALLLDQAKSLFGVPVEILSGSEEARLSFLGVTSFLNCPENSVVVDVGGASTELVCAGYESVHSVSIPVGSVVMTEMFNLSSLSSSGSMHSAKQYVRNALRASTAQFSNKLLHVIASGGTATALAALSLKLPFYDEKKVHGHTIKYGELTDIVRFLSKLEKSKRNRLPGLDVGRGEIVLAGAIIFMIILNILKADSMEVSDTGLLEGILLDKLLMGHC